VASCILGNAYQGIICAMDVAWWDTSFKIATRPKGMVLVHLKGNGGMTRLSVTIIVVKAWFTLFWKG
jgi:hypothetical protein